MQDVLVKVDLLRTQIQANRAKHRLVFEAALEVYHERVIRFLEDRIADIKEGRRIEHRITMPIPEDHTADYDRVLAMLDMSVEDEVRITQYDFGRLVRDEWEWRDSFAANTGSYTTPRDPGV